jgi:hypothetical protein
MHVTTGNTVRKAPAPHRVFAATIALLALISAAFGSWAARVPDISAQVGATLLARRGALLHLGR